MKFNKKDYDKIKYKIHLLKTNESVFDLGDLAPYKDYFSKQNDDEDAFGIEPDFLMKFLILMYSKGSPAIEKFDHIGKRTTWVLSQLGVEPDLNNRYDDSVNYLVNRKCESVVRKTSVFLTLQAPVDWQILLHGQAELHYLLEMKDRDEDGELKATLADITKKRELIEETRKQMEEARARIMEHEPSLLQELDIQVFAAQTFLGIRMEELIGVIPPMRKPHEQKGDTFFPEVPN